jgi:hypothetical protein
MKEVSSHYEDTEKRLAVFIGLGAFLLSSLAGLFQGLSPEHLLLRGVILLFAFAILGWAYGSWLKHTLAATAPEEELPANVERRRHNAESLDEGSLMTMPGRETEVEEQPGDHHGAINFTLPEFDPAQLAGAPVVEEAAAAAPAAAK